MIDLDPGRYLLLLSPPPGHAGPAAPAGMASTGAAAWGSLCAVLQSRPVGTSAVVWDMDRRIVVGGARVGDSPKDRKTNKLRAK